MSWPISSGSTGRNNSGNARASVERLKADPEAWQGYLDEIAEWDSLAGDGLENEEPYYSPQEEAEIEAEYARTYGR